MKPIFKKNQIIRVVHIAAGLIILIALNLAGQWISPFIPFPMPGSVIGLMLIFLLLILGWLPLSWVDDAATILLLYLGLFYVPYGVGIIDVDPLVGEIWWKIIPIVITVVLIVMLSTGKLLTFFNKKMKH